MTAGRRTRSAGTKTRKLEYLVADALAKGSDTLVSIGGVQSNLGGQPAINGYASDLQPLLSWAPLGRSV